MCAEAGCGYPIALIGLKIVCVNKNGINDAIDNINTRLRCEAGGSEPTTLISLKISRVNKYGIDNAINSYVKIPIAMV